MSRRPWKAWALRAAVMAIAAMPAAGCASNDESDLGLSDSTTASIEATTTTSETTTTSTTTTQPTSTTLDDEAAVRELHTRFMTEFVARDEREVTLEEQIAELQLLAIDPQLQRSTEVLTARYSRGEYAVNPGYDSNVVSLDLKGEEARVIDCSQGRGELYSSEGDLLVAADDFYKLRATEFKKIDGRWWLTDFITGGDERCDPDE